MITLFFRLYSLLGFFFVAAVVLYLTVALSLIVAVICLCLMMALLIWFAISLILRG
jgi:hypothetical protein